MIVDICPRFIRICIYNCDIALPVEIMDGRCRLEPGYSVVDGTAHVIRAQIDSSFGAGGGGVWGCSPESLPSLSIKANLQSGLSRDAHIKY